jgi:hypothetical protein
LHRGIKWAQSAPLAADEFDYGPLDRLATFSGTHPLVMQDVIARMDWRGKLQFSGRPDPAREPHKHERLKYRILTFLEQRILGGRQLEPADPGFGTRQQAVGAQLAGQLPNPEVRYDMEIELRDLTPAIEAFAEVLRHQPDNARALISQAGATPLHSLSDRLWLVQGPVGLGSLRLANQLQAAGLFESAQPNWWVPRTLK